MERVCLVFLGCALTASAGATPIYKCKDVSGNVTLSDVRCPDNPEKLKMEATKRYVPMEIFLPQPEVKREETKSVPWHIEGPKELRTATEEEEKRCLAEVISQRRFKDPQSIRFDSPSMWALYGSGRMDIMLDINAKNSYGAYAGSKISTCTFSPDGKIESVW